MTKLLIQYSSIVDLPDYKGFTPLCISLAKHNLENFSIFVENGADLSFTLPNGKTIEQIARKRGFHFNNENVKNATCLDNETYINDEILVKE